MKKYLDYALLSGFLTRYFPDGVDRLVGPNHDFDSGYFDIIRFFGKQKFDPTDVRINHLPDTYSFSDQLIASFASDREKELKAVGRLYEGALVTRAAAMQMSGQSSSITVQPCRYADQAGTCFSLDWQDERFTNSGGTLREYYKQKSGSSSFADIPFPLCFGVCGFLLVRNESEPSSILLMHRSGNLASLEDSVGPSMAGAVDYDERDRTLSEMLFRSANQEIEEELLLAEHEYQCIPLAFAREIFRGERPQLFCLVITNLSTEVIAQRLQDGKTEQSEFTRFAFIALENGKLPESEIASLNHEARMSYWLTLEYLAGSKLNGC